MIYKWINNIHKTLFPGNCLLCGGSTGTDIDLCQDCRKDLPRTTITCRHCGVPLTGQGGICGSCQKEPPYFERVISPLLYMHPVDRLVQQFKYHQGLHHGRLLAELMYHEIAKEQRPLPELVLPVPLHDSRLRERGYNQALELARPLAKRLGIGLDWRSCQRVRKTDPQQSLSAKARQKNLRGAFELAQGFTANHVAIVDDVMTTGQTANNLAKLLRKQGAQTIEVWVAARAPLGY